MGHNIGILDSKRRDEYVAFIMMCVCVLLSTLYI